MEQPFLSVCIITYNHENYIREAIESVLMQKVNFSYEIIIADDFSTDKTREIILEYVEKYPNLFNVIFQKKNVGAVQNWLDLLNKPKSKYIAYFEGDDYWIDPYKLQKQVDFLEENEEIIASFHNTEERYSEELLKSSLYNKFMQTARIITISDMLLFNIVPTSSLVFRLKDLPTEIMSKQFRQLNFGDWPLSLLLARKGDFYYFPFIMSVRRMHPNSIWGMQDQNKNIRKTIDSLSAMISFNWFDHDVNFKLGETIELLQSNHKSKGLIYYLLNKIINFLIKLKRKI